MYTERASRMTTRSSMKLLNRRRLIDAALELSAAKGFSTLSLREVTLAAGLSPAAFYGHFRDMEDLGLSLLDEVGLSLRRLLREARIRTIKDPRGTARASVDVFLEYVNENKNLFRIFLGERQGASTTFRRAIHAEIDQFVIEVTEDLEASARSEGHPVQSIPYAAEAIVAVVFTVGAEALDLPKHKQEALASRLVEEVKIILRGALYWKDPTSAPDSIKTKIPDISPLRGR
ncbi:MAG: HTH-type transcriptional repressor FabR [Proteobacteria bacterium]|nr:MAG: HTH-type transcriptional repressor FabR [Pseudomonadota bacterium]